MFETVLTADQMEPPSKIGGSKNTPALEKQIPAIPSAKSKNIVYFRIEVAKLTCLGLAAELLSATQSQ